MNLVYVFGEFEVIILYIFLMDSFAHKVLNILTYMCFLDDLFFKKCININRH